MRKGQTVILLALAMVVLLIVAGFAIDSGRLYRVRHILQNAADAGALAGAQVLARGTRTTQRAIWEAINQKIQMNLALNNITGSSVIRAYLRNDAGTEWEITNTNSNQPPPLANRVRVEIRRPEVVLFGRFLGQTSANVGASAQAQFGILRTLPPFSNIVPIAIHYEIVANANEGDLIVAWDGYQTTVLQQNGNRNNYGDPSNPYSGWLNLAWIHNSEYDATENREIDQSHSQANVDNWIRNGNPYKIIAGSLMGNDGDFIMGNPGIRASGLRELENKRLELINQGQRPIFYFVVFDRYFDRNGMRALFPSHSNFPNATYFHVVGYVSIEVTEVRWQGSDKYVKGFFVNFTRAGDVLQNSGAPNSEELVKGVVLIQ